MWKVLIVVSVFVLYSKFSQTSLAGLISLGCLAVVVLPQTVVTVRSWQNSKPVCCIIGSFDWETFRVCGEWLRKVNSYLFILLSVISNSEMKIHQIFSPEHKLSLSLCLVSEKGNGFRLVHHVDPGPGSVVQLNLYCHSFRFQVSNRNRIKREKCSCGLLLPNWWPAEGLHPTGWTSPVSGFRFFVLKPLRVSDDGTISRLSTDYESVLMADPPSV